MDRDQYWYEHYQELIEILGFKDDLLYTHKEIIDQTKEMVAAYHASSEWS